MVNSLLFKWEDSQALKHHCGICERPLSHPGARASCFGTHSEPCHRFHQAMFMRLRAHTCTYCLTIEEAHWKRHKELAETLSNVYESCGEVEWSIIPIDLEERERLGEFDAGSADSRETDRSLTPEDTPSSKRERKDAKRLARAASRSRVVTQDEIAYVDSVLHLAERLWSSDSDGPRNPEEIEEIERHLRYNAQVYNTQPNRRGLKKFAQLPDADVDFDAEMERILETFRISVLVKRNTRNRGLQGKELKTFQALVDDFKKAVVEDLVLVKKDVLEIRMRRAGYLRYTNKTAYGIVEDRYTDKDWRTGEKFVSNSSDSSAVISLVEDVSVPESKLQENLAPQPLSSTNTPDRRHLENIHKRVNGDDGLYDPVIEPYRTPLLPLRLDPTPSKKPISLKVVAATTPAARVGTTYSAWGKKNTRQQQSNGWETVSNGKKPAAMAVKPAHRPAANLWAFDESDFPDPSSSGFGGEGTTTAALAVQVPATAAVSVWSKPEQFVAPVVEQGGRSSQDHPVVSQKRVKKASREAKRKIKKATAQEDHVDASTSLDGSHGEALDDFDMVLSSASTILIDHNEGVREAHDSEPPEAVAAHSKKAEADTVEMGHVDAVMPESLVELTPQPTSVPFPVTKQGKHMHWIKFTRNFIVDQLTDPFLPSWSDCSHGTSCAFEGNDVVDCPFHEPHCSCVDPLQDKCYLVYPDGDLCSSGPYNRLRGDKLMAMYEEDSRTKGRLMLVDDDLLYYFMEDPSTRGRDRDPSAVPKRLAAEHADFANGYTPGPLMEQERQFERLWQKNKVIKQQISRKMLQDIQRQRFERPGKMYMCYCQDTVPEEGLLPKHVIMCSRRECNLVYFHKSCVKNLGVEKVSRWFCTFCENEMKVLARQTLRDLGYTDIPNEEDVDVGFDEKKLKEALKMPDGVYNQLKEGVKHLGGRVSGVGAMAFDVDGSGKVTAHAPRRLC